MRAINKKSKIVLGCLAFLLSLSVGYAYFSKTTTITGTVTGKGSFDISLTCTKSISTDFVNVGYVTSSDISSLQFGYSTDTCTVSGNNVTVTTALDYPGATRIYTIIMKNNGTIRAKWNYIDGFTNNIQQCVYEGGTSTCENTPDKTYLTASESYFQMLPSIRYAGFKDASGNFTVTVDDDIQDLADSNGDIYLEAGESLYFLVWNVWDSDFDDYNYRDGAYSKFTLDFDFAFEQATD